MIKTTKNTPISILFRQWSRNAWAIFASLHIIVHNHCIKISSFKNSLFKQKNIYQYLTIEQKNMDNQNSEETKIYELTMFIQQTDNKKKSLQNLIINSTNNSRYYISQHFLCREIFLYTYSTKII